MRKLFIFLVMIIALALVGCKKEKEEPIKEEDKVWVEVKVIDYYPMTYIEYGNKQERAYLVVEKDGKKYAVKTNVHPLSVQLMFPKNSALEVEEKELKPYGR